MESYSVVYLNTLVGLIPQHLQLYNYPLTSNKFIHWTLGDVEVISQVYFSNSFNILISLALAAILALGESYQVRSYYLSQILPISMSPYGVTRPEWVKNIFQIKLFMINVTRISC